MKTIVKICGLLLLFGLMNGCIRDDRGKCPPGTGAALLLRYYGDGDRDIFRDKIGEVTLYIYDNTDGHLVETTILSDNQLRNQEIEIDLPSGDYHAVAWGNFYQETEAEGTDSLSTGIIGLRDYFTRDVVRTSDSLYFGKLNFIVPHGEAVNDTVFFSSAHINMVLGLEDLRDEAITEGVSPVSFRLTGLSPMADFDGRVSDVKTSYFPTTAPEGDDFVARFNTLRFGDVNDIMIDLFYDEADEPMFTLDLADYMSGHDITVEGINEITIGIRFIFTGHSVRVENWVENEITPGI
jgi:Protein of unknown function (DUF1812).